MLMHATLLPPQSASTHHINDHASEGEALLSGEIHEDIATGKGEQIEGHCQMIVFQHRGVIVQYRQCIV